MRILPDGSRTFFSRCGQWCVWLEELFLCLLLTAMIGLACVQILLRVLYNSGFMWADPLLRHMVLWAGLFGAAAATRHGKHIAIDVASFLLPQKVQPWLRVAINLFAAVVCGFLTHAAILFVSEEAAYGGRALLSIPSWVLNLAFPLAFALICGRFLFRAIAEAVAIATAARPFPPERR
ncbi:MAG: TRAP transporter small permease [Desulfobulbaceae bacterium]|nr:TRAP transporter small permease [Desulfobulbaceae bacterium]